MRTDLTQYDERPRAMINYLRNYGPHFNRKLFEFAIDNMSTSQNGKEAPLNPYSKEQVEKLLQQYGISLNNNQLYDAVYVANMCKADFLKSSIIDERHLAMYVKDVIDDIDGYDGIVFNRWYADMSCLGIAIDWEEML